MESELLYEMKKMNGALGKQPRLPTGDNWMEAGGFMYHKLRGGMSGNTAEHMILVSVGNKFPADVAVKQRIKNSALATKATQIFGSLPSIVPGLHEEAAADLMATASTIMRSSSSTVVQLCLDVAMMQRSKQYYLKKIEEFFQNCKLPVGKSYIPCNYTCIITADLCIKTQLWYTTWATVRKALVTGAAKMGPSASRRSLTFTGSIVQTR